MPTRTTLTRTSFPVLLVLVTLSGCGESSGTFDTGLAEAYTEVVLAEAMHPDDTVAWREMLDERLPATRYESPEEVLAAVEDLAATDSRGFTALMDSVQMRLERIRTGTDD